MLSCAALHLSVRDTTLETATLICDVAPTQPGPNQIQLRFTVVSPCDFERAEADVRLDNIVLAHDTVTRQLFAGVGDSFDSSAFSRPAPGTLLTAELRATCSKGGKHLTASDQCRIRQPGGN